MLVKNNEAFKVNTTKNMGRFYIKDGIKYPSVTTIIHFSDVSEKKFSGTSPAAAIGSLTHYHILKKYSKTRLEPPTDMVWRLSPAEVHGRINRCLQMWHELSLNIEPIEVECALFCDNPKFAGRLDMLANIDGILTLLDIKTGLHYDDHILQASSYWHALDRQPERVMYVYLDSIVERNPSQKATILNYYEDELLDGWEQFKNRYINYVMPTVI